MPTAPDVLYDRLQDPAEVARLFGTAEDTILDCKQWRGEEKGKRLMLARAVSGFANGDGGVIAIGLIADSHGKDDPDVIKEPAYVQAPHEAKAQVLSFIQSDVEPLIQGLRVDVVQMETNGAGVVLVLVPSQDGLPVRSKQDWKFYLRSGSSTQNMPMNVLSDRFGRRPHAELRVTISGGERHRIVGYGEHYARRIDVFVSNVGRGIARFPALLLERATDFYPDRDPYVPEKDQSYIWPLSLAEARWISFRGGADAVVYPGERLKVCAVLQNEMFPASFKFAQAELRLAAVCDGAALKSFTFVLPEQIL